MTTKQMTDNFNLFVTNGNKIKVSLEDGEAQEMLYFYCGDGNGTLTKYTFNFTIAAPDASSDPEPEDVDSISITAPPSKVAFFAGDHFDPAGMVVMAKLKAGGDLVPILGYSVEPSDVLTLSDTRITVRFGEHTAVQEIEVLPSTAIGNVEITNGQMMSDVNYFGLEGVQKKTRQYDAVTLYGEAKGKFTIQVGEGAEVWIGDARQTVTDGVCKLELDTSRDGARTVVQIRSTGTSTDYTFWCYEQVYGDMPQRVEEYLCIASQFTNGAGTGSYGLNGVATLRGNELTNTTKLSNPSVSDELYGSNTSINGTPISLGNFGGYITYYYEKPIIDNPNNPYGVDFIVYGNSHDGGPGFAEPGNVLVSEDGEHWYSLAGSLHYDDAAIWGYSMTYKPNASTSIWTDNYGGAGKAGGYPVKEFYPLFPWTPELEREITLTGTLLVAESGKNEYGNTVPPFPHFGYADCGIKVDTNVALNPYTGLVDWVSARNDGFDLKWAVDEKGMPVDVSDKGFHYVKVQTATNILNSAIGEKSTEINGMRLTAPTPSKVGTTQAPASITVDGKAVALQDGVYVYNDVPVSGAFVVNVNTPNGSNIYINGSRGASSTYKKMPNHKMLRIIVQEGEKEPWIGYFNLVEGQPDENDQYTLVKFDPGYGRIEGAYERTYTPDTPDKSFPVPVWEKREFLGWYDKSGKKYDQYTPDMPKEIALTAQWKYILQPDEDPTVKVTFRLIGSTRSKGDVDLSKGDEGYYGAKYVTWRATRQWTMEKGSTVYDLFVLAMEDAGLITKGEGKNYVSDITAPCGAYKLSEFTNGERSGWMYTVNGKHPPEGLQYWDLKKGDKVIWHYVNDYSYEVADWESLGGKEYPPRGDGKYWNKWLEAKDVDPNCDDVLGGDAATGSTTLAPKVTALKGVASVSIKASDMTGAITDAKKNSSKTIVIAPEITGTAKKVSVELPKSSLSSVASDTDADLMVQTPVGNVTIPNSVLPSVVSQAAGSEVIISIEAVDSSALTENQQKTVGSGLVYDVSILSGGKKITNFSGGSITVSLPYTLKTGEDSSGVTVWYLNDKGELEKIACKYDKNTGLATFTTNHLSYYMVDWVAAWKNPFTDVKDTDWFYGAVEYAVKNSLFNGTTTTTFSPNSQMTRAMLVTVLYRLEGSPAAKAEATGAAITKSNGFTDVKSGQWYSDAVSWANANGIVAGTGNGRFGTNNDVTREQMATILYNYSNYKGYNTSVTAAAEIGGFNDAAAVSGWAQAPMKWANSEKLITGRTATTLAPDGNASRAEVATILKRFAESGAE
ncbi:MAG TPA: S-layer homology domain-containing protein [Bacillota bacterium]|nr:S-layer homology domain-containing protein [Bacillota bacterium]